MSLASSFNRFARYDNVLKRKFAAGVDLDAPACQTVAVGGHQLEFAVFKRPQNSGQNRRCFRSWRQQNGLTDNRLQ